MNLERVVYVVDVSPDCNCNHSKYFQFTFYVLCNFLLNFFLFVLISDTLFAEVVFGIDNSVYVNLLHIYHQFINHSKQNIHLLIIRTAYSSNIPEDLYYGTEMSMLAEIWYIKECAKHTIKHFSRATRLL